MDAKSSKTPAGTSRQFLRHTLANVAYALPKRCGEFPAPSRNFGRTSPAGRRAQYWRTSAICMIGRALASERSGEMARF